jgi:hypothetical chaperone protein
VPHGDIDTVFLTGGSSFIPAVRRVIEERFGRARLADRENLQSVAFGLALIGLEEDLEPWLAGSVIGQKNCNLGEDPS